MSFDINKPFTRRDGIAVDWCEPVDVGGGAYIYGFTIEGVRDFAIVSKGGRSGVPQHNTDNDLINTPEYEWAAIYLESDGTVSVDKWYPRKGAALAFLTETLGLLRRPKDSEDHTKYELLPLDTEVT